MIRHIALFKLKEFSSEDERNVHIEQFLFNFRSLVGEIAQIREYRVAENIITDPESFDIVIDSSFDSAEDLKAYQNHPAHQYAMDQNIPWCEKKAVVDYEI